MAQVESDKIKQVLANLDLSPDTQHEILDGLDLLPVYERQFLVTVKSTKKFSRSRDLDPALEGLEDISGFKSARTTSCSGVRPNGDYHWTPTDNTSFAEGSWSRAS